MEVLYDVMYGSVISIHVKENPCIVLRPSSVLKSTGKYLSQTKKTVIVDVVIVNSVMRPRGRKEVKGVRIKGCAAATRQETRVDGDLTP